ncbi:TorF family putative porin [Rugamonas rivuli]|uniref:Uncharacterized protein n=1 Tax=Rugamonas rivuli TaxID=2743358 RepID=A0A843SBS1_9BURK|nr:TorF family putative porin [Rugamonas rivuli]MQA18016.1 hypothetical protein [Rugamonas rivuli]
MTLRAAALACIAILPLLPWRHAMAQTDFSGSVALQSDYRYRGQSLGDGQVVPQLTLNLDHVSGWYAGLFASGAAMGDLNGYKVQAYGGYALRLRSGWSVEAGCSRSSYTQLHFVDFNECYAGASAERFTTRLYYSPRYFGHHARTLYGEVNLFYPVHPSFNLIAHAGLLHTLSGMAWPGVPAGSRHDYKLGASVPLGNWTIQLAREQTQDDGIRYNHYPPRPARAWVLSSTYSF